jgi:hypothetical protein
MLGDIRISLQATGKAEDAAEGGNKTYPFVAGLAKLSLIGFTYFVRFTRCDGSFDPPAGLHTHIHAQDWCLLYLLYITQFLDLFSDFLGEFDIVVAQPCRLADLNRFG